MIGQNGLLSTPAVSALIRKLNEEKNGSCVGGILLTASHNPGGENEDFGIKFNCENGGPAPESLTDEIFNQTLKIKSFTQIQIPKINIDEVHEGHKFGDYTVSVVDSCSNYIDLMKKLFNFPQIKAFVGRQDFKMTFDGMHGVAGPYAKKIFTNELGVPESDLMRCDVLEDFGGGHPDPNLTYAAELVKKMGVASSEAGEFPDFGAACDGDADRNMILGKQFFVTPSDSIAIIAANSDCIPFLKGKMTGAARSMPTSAALDRVNEKLGLANY